MPYVMDQGASCGQGFVNSGPGTLDGYTMVEGHEYAETITDQNPAGGWTNHTGSSYNGEENADECAWLSSGQGAAAQRRHRQPAPSPSRAPGRTTPTAATSRTRSSAAGAAATPSRSPTRATRAGRSGTATSLQIHASDSATGQTLTYSATGLPAGLSINSSQRADLRHADHRGDVLGHRRRRRTRPARPARASFTWTISTGGGGGCSGQKFLNPGFESGAANWSATSGVINTDGAHSHAGSGYAWLDGYGTTHTDTLSQAGGDPVGLLGIADVLPVDQQQRDGTTTAYDKLSISANGTVVTTYSNVNKGTGYVLRTINLSAYAGQTVTVKWTGTEDSSLATSFFVDDTALTLS